jgi:hypothetical protein
MKNKTKITFDNLGHPSFWYFGEDGVTYSISRREYIAKTQIHTYKVRGGSVNIQIDVNTINEARDIVRNHFCRPEWVDNVFKAHHDINGVVKGLRYRGI